MDEPGRLAKPDRGVFGVSLRERMPVPRTLDARVSLEFVFPPMPPVRERVTADAPRELSWPRDLAGDVRHPGPHRAVAVGLDDCPVVTLLHEGLARCP